MLKLVLVLAMIAIVAAFRPMTVRSIARPLSMVAKEGDVVPTITFKARVRDDTIPGPNPFKWKDITTNDLFNGKRVVLFALPGGWLFLNIC